MYRQYYVLSKLLRNQLTWLGMVAGGLGDGTGEGLGDGTGESLGDGTGEGLGLGDGTGEGLGDWSGEGEQHMDFCTLYPASAPSHEAP